MTSKKQLLRVLIENDVNVILVGGLALRIYNSPRVTHDMDLAIRSLDIDSVIELMYKHGFFMVTSVDENNAYVQIGPKQASEWIDSSGMSSMTFVEVGEQLSGNAVPLTKIDITTQVDFLFDLSVPFMRLMERASMVQVDDFSIQLASAEDLLRLKSAREDKTGADFADIEFLKELLAKKGL